MLSLITVAVLTTTYLLRPALTFPAPGYFPRRIVNAALAANDNISSSSIAVSPNTSTDVPTLTGSSASQTFPTGSSFSSTWRPSSSIKETTASSLSGPFATGSTVIRMTASASLSSKNSTTISHRANSTTKTIPPCYITSSTPAASLTAMGLTGPRTYCTCGEIIAGINFAVSGASTTTYCAMGSPVPTGFSQIQGYNGHPVTPAAQIASAASAAAQSSAAAAAEAKCTNGAIVDQSCFNQLDLPDFIKQWWTTKQAQCGQLAFAECFYRLETKYAPSNCAEISNNQACTAPRWSDFDGSTNAIHRFYVAWIIYNSNGFFLDIYGAVGAAQGSVAASLPATVDLFNPVKHANVALQDVLLALTFGLSLYSEGSNVMKAVLRSGPQSTALVQKLYPEGTVDGQYQTWDDVSKNVGKATDAWRRSIAAGLPQILNNVTAFIEWSQMSGLSGMRPPLNGLADSMTQALNTYAVGRVIAALGLFLGRAPNTDVHQLQTNGSKLNWDTGCGGGYTQGVCATYFFDGVDTYAIVDPGHMKRDFSKEMAKLFAVPGAPLTGPLVFTGAQRCYEQTEKNGGSPPKLDTTDFSQFYCLSNPTVCTWAEDGFGPFDASCPNLPNKNAVLPYFGVSGCIGQTGETTSIDVPRGYLGPGVYQDNKNITSIEVDSFCDNIDYKI